MSVYQGLSPCFKPRQALRHTLTESAVLIVQNLSSVDRTILE